MELKNAVAVCLIALFSAGLVVLIARSLDLQIASQQEAKFDEIIKELRAIRKGGGVALAPGDGQADASADVDDGLVVYYLHGNQRCPTCNSIESQTRETVESDFGPQLEAGQVVWKVVNYEKPAGRALQVKFELVQSSLVLARVKGGEIADWKRLDQVWALVGNASEFREYVAGEIAEMLSDGHTTTATPGVDGPATGAESPDLPVPDEGVALPVP